MDSIDNMTTFDNTGIEKAILIGIDTGAGKVINGRSEAERSLDELGELSDTAGLVVVSQILQKREVRDAAYYIGRGKLQEISRAAEELGAGTLVFDDELSGAQIRNIEEQTDAKVVDRTMLILDIFAQRARSSEGKLQVELAQLKYRLPRLIGLGGQLSRLGGGIGTRGPGEKKLETDRRHIRKRISRLEAELKVVSRRRSLLREGRRQGAAGGHGVAAGHGTAGGYGAAGLGAAEHGSGEHGAAGHGSAGGVSGSAGAAAGGGRRGKPGGSRDFGYGQLPIIALTGYTNSGKSTMLNRLCGADVLAEDRLFATLDPTTRKVLLPGGREALVVDTVGFIRKLPHELVEAFKSTLEEVVFADVLLHIADASDEEVEEHIKVAEGILDSLGAASKPALLVLNKADLVGGAGTGSSGPVGGTGMGSSGPVGGTGSAGSSGLGQPGGGRDRLPINSSRRYLGVTEVSALTGQGIDELLGQIEKALPVEEIEVDILAPYTEGWVSPYLRGHGTVLAEEFTGEGVKLRARISKASVEKIREFVEQLRL